MSFKIHSICVCTLTWACVYHSMCIYMWVHVCASDPILGALRLQVNSMSMCLSRPAEFRLSAESNYPVLGSMREHFDLSRE